MLDLSGRVALVTGAGSGIGKAIAIEFARAGAQVACVDINVEKANSVADEICSLGAVAIAVQCDVSVSSSVVSAVAQVLQDLTSLHIVVNCAVIFIPDNSIDLIDETDWKRSFAVNVDGAFLTCKYSIPEIARSGGGSIINVASVLGHVGKEGRSWYCAQKAALIGMTKAMAIDHVSQGIRVNSLSPGPVGTEQFVSKYGGIDEANRRRGADTIMGRIAEPHEVATAALFLASDEASFITGTDLLVDGGLTSR